MQNYLRNPNEEPVTDDNLFYSNDGLKAQTEDLFTIVKSELDSLSKRA
jgi:hypothetical protein